ncbi:CYFA0S11e02212g1_1 [Cyberlindnera fabianii]|uniref:CYFA0S11e02212g1_1 n=1 Tax=Cyberlindnera fabianii TaxID=36022 RepID=A0A061B8L3_CYBFA|nr:Meiotically up-regulated gene 14 protein [Cyberlindnera fabianii]CDR43239.1 CYFA0S11e02212g1_1 [Cyberlindnera fabianii]
MSQTATQTATPSLKLEVGAEPQETKQGTNGLPQQGVHNLVSGQYEYRFKRPTFTDKYEEREFIKQHLAGAFRVFGRKGYTEGSAGHISVRDPVDPETFWINPLGRHFSLMRVSDLVHVDKEGNVIGGNKAAVNAAGFKIHSELHKARPDVNAACHTHSVWGKAYSTFGKPLDMINQDVCVFYKKHSVYTNFGGVVLEGEEGRRLAKALGDGKGIILQNHGLLTVGETVDEAAYLFTLMERSCEVQMKVDAMDSKYEKVLVGDEEAAFTYHMTSDPESLYADFQPDLEYEFEMTNGAYLK